jgi:hypothetical protein
VNGTAKVATDAHPNWEAIRQAVVVDDDPNALDLFDLSGKAADKFQRLTDRVTVHSGRVHFDGDPVDNSLTQKVVEAINAGLEDWKPLVKFYDKVMQNPEEHSREQLFDWLNNNAFSINEDGDIVGYKGVRASGKDGFAYSSVMSGVEPVNVDGEIQTGYIHTNLGSVVEMPRSLVQHDPNVGCSVGLHVSNFQYASSYGTVQTVIVNPRDVVSIPNDHSFQKGRVCRYRVAGVTTVEHTGVVVEGLSDEDDEDDDDYGWGFSDDLDSDYSW